MRELVLISCALFTLSALALMFWSQHATLLYAAVAVWGLAFGGLATLLQTALAKAADSHADAAQSMLVTAWNLAIAGGGLIGGVLLEGLGVLAFPWVIAALLLMSLLATANARQHGFPSLR